MGRDDKDPNVEMISCDIRISDAPACYDLTMATDLNALMISFPEAVVSEMGDVMAGKPYIDDFAESLDIKERFVGPTQPLWGYGEVFQMTDPIRANWMSYKCPIPGFRRDRSYQNDLYRICASLDLAFNFSSFSDDGEVATPQLIDVMSDIQIGLHLAGFEGYVSRALKVWLSGHYSGQMEEPSKALVEMFKHTSMPKLVSRYNSHEYYVAMFNKHWLTLNCGDETGLVATNYGREDVDPDEGYKLHPHNMDSPQDRLAMLAGLARTCQLYREAH